MIAISPSIEFRQSELPKMAIFGQSVPNIEANQIIAKKWQHLDKSSSNMGAKNGKKR